MKTMKRTKQLPTNVIPIEEYDSGIFMNLDENGVWSMGSNVSEWMSESYNDWKESFEDQADEEVYDQAEGHGEEQVQDIPESVKPDQDSAQVPAFAEDVLRPEMTLQAKLAGYGAALAIFGLIIINILVFQKKIIELTFYWLPP